MVLNINRESMADAGFSPPTRIFEAAGAAACTITDKWPGIPMFFAPGHELLLAGDAEEIVDHLRRTSAEQARSIGAAMQRRALAEHTYAQRAVEFEKIVLGARADRHPSAVDAALLQMTERPA
jgi:spore maturation protein CgeB